MKTFRIFLFIISVVILGPFSVNGENGEHDYNYVFSDNDYGWEGLFVDYPIGSETAYQLETDYIQRPENIEGGKALFIKGRNRSDDLFMGYKKKEEGLEPNTSYKVNFSIELLSKYPFGSIGIGGSPANSVFLKAGASKLEPEAVLKENNYYRLNIDKSNQSGSGADMIVIGDIAKPKDGTSNYEIIERDSRRPSFRMKKPKSLIVESDINGNIWLIFGTDSGYEGTTALYYTKFSAHFVPLTDGPNNPRN